MVCADIILPVPLEGMFTYTVPESMVPEVRIGARVMVSFGAKRSYIGIVARIHDTPPEGLELKEISKVLGIAVLESQLTLWRWVADYYMSPIGEVYKAALPAILRTKESRRGRNDADCQMSRERTAITLHADSQNASLKELTSVQQRAYDDILTSFETKSVTLLHGVTSSGKTEIYIRLIMREIAQGRQVLYLLPEIALTIQIMNRLQAVFGSRIGIYHSRFTDAERARLWERQLSKEHYDIILGARSAVFLPFQHLGLVIIDEEQDSSYKQQEPTPRYNGRNVAIMLAHQHGAKTLLGTATPCMETYYNAFMTGKYGLVGLYERYAGMALPEVRIADIALLRHRKEMRGIFSPILLSCISEALERGEQVILFQNRRGFSTMLQCRTCGWTPRCGQCDVSLTYHRTTDSLTCHYCGRRYDVPKACPACESTELSKRGVGTEKVEEQVRALFPESRIARMDIDTTKKKDAYASIINDFSEGRTDILIGTQMVSKGLDFGRVSVVGILDADTMMSYPDFRAYEQAFIMMSQVSGRAGRSGHRGTVVLQTRNADNPLLSQVVNNDYRAFYNELAEERQAFHYPPYTRIVAIYLRHRHDAIVTAASRDLANALTYTFGSRVLGPDRPPVGMVRMMNIRKIILKVENGMDMGRVRNALRRAQTMIAANKNYSSLQIYFDIDPV